ncbi:hypothetical protein AGMMS49938_07590 [Fibrobacterales bacterium]|nr:hypothetical protein AGMMS49938_07590 [Fibrobacterales bacterium]
MPLLLLLSFSLAFADISFAPVNLGLLQQGIKKEVSISGQNTFNQAIEVETVIDQMTGGDNFQFPKKISPNEKFTIKFTLSTAYMEGDFTHNIILIATDGKPFVAQVSGSVENPIIFSERILDLGFYKQGNKKNWVLYAWNAQGKPINLKLASNSSQEFTAEFTEVKIDTSDFENIKEISTATKPSVAVPATKNIPDTKTTPATKINLSVKKLQLPKNNQKSIRQIVSFESKTFPNSTPEILITGYWE